MFEGQYYPLKLIQLLGKDVRGRKKLQKVAYLLQFMRPEFDLPYEFSYHHYGPYSADLSATLANAVSEKLVEENVEFDETTSEVVAYNYHLSEKGELLLNELEKNKWVKPFRADDDAQGFIDRFKAMSSSILELASTVLYLMEYGESAEKAEEKGKELKPHLSKHFDAAFKLAREISNIRRVEACSQ